MRHHISLRLAIPSIALSLGLVAGCDAFPGSMGANSTPKPDPTASPTPTAGPEIKAEELGNFSVFGNLEGPRHGHLSFVSNDHLYVLGGFAHKDSKSFLSTWNVIQSAKIQSDGSLGAFSPPATLSVSLAGGCGILIGSTYYYGRGYHGDPPGGGGRFGGSVTIKSDGSWTEDKPELGLYNRNDASLLRVGDSVYAIGGIRGSDSYPKDILKAIVNQDGSLAPFQVVEGLALATGRTGAAIVTIGNYVYLIGGAEYNPENTYSKTVNTVWRASIVNGELSPFTNVADVTLNAARFRHTCTVVGNYVYVVGGMKEDENPNPSIQQFSFFSTIERALIKPDGTLGSFEVVDGVTLREARAGHTAERIGRYLYIIGGHNSHDWYANQLQTIERAEIQ